MQKLLPPFLFLGLLAGLAVLAAMHPILPGLMHESGIPYAEVAFAVFVGLLLLVGARLQFKQNESEIMTFDEPRGLVTDKLFAVSRNPMYLGFTLLLLAAALAVNLWCALLAPIAFFIAADRWYIPFEERAAVKAFGADYEEYRRKTRRWI